MKILLTGATGYVGKMICERFAQEWEITGVSSSVAEGGAVLRCDLADPTQVATLTKKIAPDVIVHAAGDKNLTRCETSPELAYASNVSTTINLIQSFPEAKIIYISSDYVFAGDRGGYREDDPMFPNTVYGKTKVCAELTGLMLSKQFVSVRLSALYDADATFIKFLRESLAKGQSVDCYTDAFYSPTYYKDFLSMLGRLASHPIHGRRVFHSCGQRISRYFFAKLFARANGFDEALVHQASRIADNAKFLFTDISLDNTLTHETLDLIATAHKDALQNMVAK